MSITMCRMLFIATVSELQEVPFNKHTPGFYLEKISGEFLPVSKFFTNQHIYFAGTERGCSCDFGCNQGSHYPVNIQLPPLVESAMKIVRKITGSYAAWQKRKQEMESRELAATERYEEQTFQLLSIILSQTQTGNTVESYCTWAGDYDHEPVDREVIDTRMADVISDFEVEEGIFKIYV